MRRSILCLLASASLLAAASSGYAQTATEPKKADAPAAKVADAEIARAPVAEIAKTSRHTVSIDGRSIAYTATAGTLTLRPSGRSPSCIMAGREPRASGCTWGHSVRSGF